MNRELLPVELLGRDDQRHSVSVADHQQWREDLATSQAAQKAQPDPIDDALADPLVERIARRRKNSEAARTLAILDELERSQA